MDQLFAQTIDHEARVHEKSRPGCTPQRDAELVNWFLKNASNSIASNRCTARFDSSLLQFFEL